MFVRADCSKRILIPLKLKLICYNVVRCSFTLFFLSLYFFALMLVSEQKSYGRAHVLHQILKGFVLRKDARVLEGLLPPTVTKEEIVITVKLSKKQQGLTRKVCRDTK